MRCRGETSAFEMVLPPPQKHTFINYLIVKMLIIIPRFRGIVKGF